MIKISNHGSFSNTERFFNKVSSGRYLKVLEKYGELGVQALRDNTPVDSGKTADSWSYEIDKTRDSISLVFSNSNVNDGVNIAVVLYYGHGTGTGGFVRGRDYITPAIQPIFDKMVDDIWKEVTT